MTAAEGKERDLSVLDDYERGIAADNWKCLRQIDEMIDVSDSYRETLRLIVFRVMSNPAIRLNFYIFAQLSEMGTGFYGTFETGGTQSDRRDDAIMWFSTFTGSVGFRIRLRGTELTFLDQMNRGSEINRTIPLVDVHELGEARMSICAMIDELFKHWWEN